MLLGVHLEEPAEHGAADQGELLGVVLERPDEGGLGEAQVQERAQEVQELGHAAVPEGLGDGRAERIARLLGVGAFDDPEACAQDALHDAEGRSVLAARPPVGAHPALALTHPRQELGDQSALADAGAADERDGLGALVGDGATEGLVELAQLRPAPDERGADEGRGGERTTRAGRRQGHGRGPSSGTGERAYTTATYMLNVCCDDSPTPPDPPSNATRPVDSLRACR